VNEPSHRIRRRPRRSLNSTGPVSSKHSREHSRRVIVDTRDILARMSGDFPVLLATRLPDWSSGGLFCRIVLPVCPCVVSPKSTITTRDALPHAVTPFAHLAVHKAKMDAECDQQVMAVSRLLSTPGHVHRRQYCLIDIQKCLLDFQLQLLHQPVKIDNVLLCSMYTVHQKTAFSHRYSK